MLSVGVRTPEERHYRFQYRRQANRIDSYLKHTLTNSFTESKINICLSQTTGLRSPWLTVAACSFPYGQTKISNKFISYFSKLSTQLRHSKILETLPFCWFIPWCLAFLERKVCEGQSLEECPVSWQFIQTACLGWWALLVDEVGPRALAGKQGKV